MAIATGTALALAASLAATGLSAYNQNRTLKKQDEAAAQSIRAQDELQRQQTGKVNQTLSEVAKSSPEDERKSAETVYLDKVRQARDVARANLSQRGLSSAYDDAANTAEGQVQTQGADLASLMARMDAPVNQRVGEGFMFQDLGAGIGQTERASSGQQWIDSLKMKGIRSNPWLDAASAALSGYGSMAGGGGTPKAAKVGKNTVGVVNNPALASRVARTA